MVSAFKSSITSENIKEKALSLGVDLVGIADGEELEKNPRYS